MRGSSRMFGASLALVVAAAIALPVVSAGAASAGSPGSHDPHTHESGGAGTAPTSPPSPAPVSHDFGSRTVVPSNWSLVPSPNVGSPNANLLEGVSCVTVTFCMAAGYAESSTADQALIERWNGTSWSVVNTPATSTSDELDAISCFTASFCIAVGYSDNGSVDQTLIEQWNGTSWSIVASPNTSPTNDNDLYGVSCTSVSFCAAVGTAENGTAEQTLAERWNGASWSIVASPNTSTTNDNNFDGVDCASSSFCQAVGYSDDGSRDFTLIAQWNGTVWSIEASPNRSGSDGDQLDGVSCSGTSFCVAVGDSDVSTGLVNLVEQWNGSTWSVAPAPDANAAFGDVLITVDCFGPTSCVAAGYVNTIDNSDATYITEMLTWNGSVWQVVNVPQPAADSQDDQVNGLSCVTGRMCVGAGYATYGASGLQTMILSAPIARPGYDEVASDGGIFNFGGAGFYGSLGSLVLNKPIVGMAVTPDGGGYWLVAADGGIFAEGDAGFFGSLGSLVLNKPIVGMAATPDGQGYWLVASDGGIFAEGDAGFFGSLGSLILNKPIVGMAATPDGQGYWLVASDGGIFAEGDAGFYGSQGGTVLNKPVVGMAATPDGRGYWMVASDGGIFTEGDAGFFGSLGSLTLNKPVVGMAATPDGRGYWMVASDGGIFTEGDAGFSGSQGGTVLNKPVVGMAA